MSTRTGKWFRRLVALGSLAAIGTLYPSATTAQTGQQQPSGAAVEVGGVTVSQPAAPGSALSGRAVVLPRTGGGPLQDDAAQNSTTAIAMIAGLTVVGTAAYLRRRGSQRRMGN